MKIVKIRHKHQITIEASGNAFEGTLSLKQLDDVLNEARVEGAPEDAITFVHSVNDRGTGSIAVEWTVERDPYGEGLKG